MNVATLEETKTAGKSPRRGGRSIIYGAVVAALVHVAWDIIFPWGGPVSVGEDFNKYAPVDYSEDSLMFKHGRTKRIVGRDAEAESRIRGPETVVINPTESDKIYLFTEDGYIVSMSDLKDDASDKTLVTAQTAIVKDLGNGRVLGGSFTSDGKTLYMADEVFGLTRIKDIHDPLSKVEIVVSSVLDEKTGHLSKLYYTDDLCIGPKTQKVYFTDATEVRGDIIGRNPPDTLYASKVDLLRGKRTGRVIEYDPETDKVRTLVDGIFFANGIAVNREESYLVFAETFSSKILKYNLKGPKAGEVEVLVDSGDMMGYPDGVDCDRNTGLCYAVMPSSVVPAHKLLAAMPGFLSVWVRFLLMMLPRQLSPPPKKFGGVLEVNPETAEFRYLLDPSGEDVSMFTGVTCFKDKLYLGSLHNTYIGTYDLSGK